MKVFEEINETRRFIVYDSFDLDLMERHHKWCNTKQPEEKVIYLIFVLQDPEEIKLYKSNKLTNSFCLAYVPHIPRDTEWIKKFCNLCFSEEYFIKNREENQTNM